MENISPPAPWSNSRKILFRFVAAYLILYIGSFLLDMSEEFLSGASPFEPFVIWIGRNVLHLNTRIRSEGNGSGDTSYSYIVLFIQLAISVIAGIIWCISDARRANYNKLLYWVTTAVRYYLAFYLMVYGYSKFNHGQFPAPGLSRLVQPYGESSPMGLAWTFLGFSSAFGIFMGFFECIGGVLMLFRCTTLLGACIAATVTTNIVAINFCYDVPVKIFSSHLLFMCIFVIVAEGRRILDFFIFNRPVQPADYSPVFASKKWQRARIVLKSIFILFVMVSPLALIIYETAEYGEEPKSPLYGVYNVREFVSNNDTLSAFTSDTTIWDKLILENEGYATIYLMNKQKKYVAFKTDTLHKTALLYTYKDTTHKYKLNYVKTDSTLTLQGVFKQDTLYIKMQRYGEDKMLLTSRGFHWINEYPFNR